MAPVNPGTLTCLTGTVTFEPQSGFVTYDDTQEKTCDFGQTKCYTQTFVATVENWPSKFLSRPIL